MSLFLFLNDKVHAAAVKALGGSVPQKAVPFNGIAIKLDADSRPFYEVRNEKGPWETMIPPPLKGHVECVSWWVTLPETCPTRTVGRYEHESAEAIVDYHPENIEFRTARINGPEIEAVYALYYQIRSGTAKLSESWQAEETEATQESPGAEIQGSAKFACGSCGAKYTMAMSKLARKTVKIRCKKCGSTMIVVNGEIENQDRVSKAADRSHIQLVKPDKDDKLN